MIIKISKDKKLSKMSFSKVRMLINTINTKIDINNLKMKQKMSYIIASFKNLTIKMSKLLRSKIL